MQKKSAELLGTFMAASLLPSLSSSQNTSHTSQSKPLKMTPELSNQIRLHAFLLWASIGLLMPLGVIIIRLSSRVQSVKRPRALLYAHVILQIAAILLATAAAALSLMNFENSFNNTHQRLGLAVYALIWIQPLVAWLRPHRGVKTRSIWYCLHWLLGTGACALGIANIYIGLYAYHERSSRRVSLWTVLFTAQISTVALIYLFQDKWDYMVKQGAILDEQVMPSSRMTSPSSNKI